MCEVQIRAGAGVQSDLFKSAVKHIQIGSQLLILQTVGEVSCNWRCSSDQFILTPGPCAESSLLSFTG